MADEQTEGQTQHQQPETPPASGEQGEQSQQQPQGEGQPQPQEQGKTFTQEEVNKMMGQVRQEARQAAIRQLQQAQPRQEQSQPEPPKEGSGKEQGEQPKTEAPQGESSQESDLAREVREMKEQVEQERKARLLQEQERQLDKLALKHELTEAQRDKLLDYYLAAQPQDGDAWIKDLREAGMLPRRTKPPEPKEDPRGAPKKVQGLERDGVVNVLTLTKEQAREMGKDQILEHYDKMVQNSRQQIGRPRLPKALRDRK